MLRAFIVIMSDKSSKSCLFIGKGREENNYSVVADTICKQKGLLMIMLWRRCLMFISDSLLYIMRKDDRKQTIALNMPFHGFGSRIDSTQFKY